MTVQRGNILPYLYLPPAIMCITSIFSALVFIQSYDANSSYRLAISVVLTAGMLFFAVRTNRRLGWFQAENYTFILLLLIIAATTILMLLSVTRFFS